MSRELPIIFNTESVSAILAERKTQTRRVIPHKLMQNADLDANDSAYIYFADKYGDSHHARDCAPYRKDDLLWVRETWLELDPQHVFMGERYYYRAGFTADSERLREEYGYKWMSPASMPKTAARLWLRVTDVRVERLQDITEADAIAEGVQAGFYDGGNWEETNDPDCPTIPAYERSWNDLNAKRGYPWEDNPWVWVYEFKQLRIEALPGKGGNG